MKKHLTLSKILIAIIVFSLSILIIYNILRPYIEPPTPNIIDCDGNCECDGFEHDFSINSQYKAYTNPNPNSTPELILIGPETYIINTGVAHEKIGYTYNVDILSDLLEQGITPTMMIEDCIWFLYDEIPVLEN